MSFDYQHSWAKIRIKRLKIATPSDSGHWTLSLLPCCLELVGHEVGVSCHTRFNTSPKYLHTTHKPTPCSTSSTYTQCICNYYKLTIVQ